MLPRLMPRIGSSPRVWGTLTIYVVRVVFLRFIPTGVGNTFHPSDGRRIESVHPHGCGEHVNLYLTIWCFSGSSPRVWGTLPWRGFRRCCFRFIPTGVGNTFLCDGSHAIPSVHPHGCGEHFGRFGRGAFGRGSSPRVWGTLCLLLVHIIRSRFIPTGVGNTVQCVSFDENLSVHPHGCGEHDCGSDGRGEFIGSSPRVWGTLSIGICEYQVLRFIPTGVGNT